MKADSLRIITVTAVIITLFTAFGHAGLGIIIGAGAMAAMADEYNRKYND